MSSNNTLYHKSFSNTSGVNVNTVNVDNINFSDANKNTGVGYRALKSVDGVNATFNTAVGWNNCINLTSGSFNTSIGYNGASSISTGGYNTGLGYASLNNANTSQYLTAVGTRALQDQLTGVNTVGLGYMSGSLDYYGSDNTFLGSQTGTDGLGIYGNSTAVGIGATISGNNQLVLGRASEKVVVLGNVSVGKTANGFTMDINGNVNFTGNLYKNGSLYTPSTPTDISCNNLTVATSMFYGANQFRYVPWTTIGTTIGNVLTAIVPTATPGAGNTTGASMPSFNNTGTNTVKYCYSVIGNTMYVDFTYYSTGGGGTTGTGKYIYLIPSGFTPNTTFITPYQIATGTLTIACGTVIGNSLLFATGVWYDIGHAWIVQHSTSSYGIGIDCQPTNSTLQGNDNRPYNSTANPLVFSFSCSFPIN